jgi:hypothetical protein
MLDVSGGGPPMKWGFGKQKWHRFGRRVIESHMHSWASLAVFLKLTPCEEHLALPRHNPLAEYRSITLGCNSIGEWLRRKRVL